MKIKLSALILVFCCSLNVNAQITVIDSIFHNNQWRNYRLFLPAGFMGSSNLPLVFNFHGYGSNALEQEAYTGFDDVADTGHFVVCYPNGLNNAWNVASSNSFDISFVDTMITVLSNQYNINLNRVYATGLSNGGFLSNLLGCTLAEKFAAIAPVAGSNTPLVQSTCNPSRHMPVLYIHGTADPVVSYNGSTGYTSAQDLMNLWANVNNCSNVTDTFAIPDISTSDMCTAERITWHNCGSNTEVIHYRIINGGHTWPGVPFIIGTTNQDFIGSSIIWEFFNRFALNTGIDQVSSTSNIKTGPNPFRNSMTIDVNNSGKSSIYLYSYEGKLIDYFESTENHIELDETHLPSGVYFLKVVQNMSMQSFKMIKL